MRHVLFLAALVLCTVDGHASAAAPFDDPDAVRLQDYLPMTAEGYDDTLPTPASVLGHEIGERFARHDLVVAWFRALADASPRVSVVDIGTTYEGRPQITAIITSSGNQRNLNRLQEQHLIGERSAPLFTWHGYSVHGNEASGTQAAMAVAWYLAASRDPKVTELLRSAVVMIDPSLNPDGYGRFSGWANQAGGRVPVEEPLHRERAESWPGGRTNHYFFDLNRDWLLLQHPESRNRVRFLTGYQPHVLTDHHEMGADRTFFFQPGAATRWHPLIPDANRRLTEQLGRFHARALDGASRLYYSGESYDDFYPGKGSTWPDLQGSVGILFEQASPLGRARATAQGRLTLPMAVHNHVLTSISTLRGAQALADEIKAYRRSYLEGDLVPNGLPAGWIFDDGGDPGRARAMLDVIRGQGLEVFGVAGRVQIEGLSFEAGRSWVVPTLGPQAPLAHALFATSTTFEDSTFYDVSAWTLPHAFGVNAAPVRRMPTALANGAEVSRDYLVRGPRSAMAWVLPWDDYFAPGVLHRLQAAGVRGRVALEPFTGTSDGRDVQFAAGAVIFHAADFPAAEERPADLLARVADGEAPFVGLDSGLTSVGPELGSPRVVPLESARVALVAGPGVNAYAAGSIWHMLDARLRIPVALVRPLDLSAAVLARHSHLIMVDGEYEGIGEEARAAIDRWVQEAGGVLVLTRGAATWAQSLGWLPAPEPVEPAPPANHPYGDMAALDGAQQVGGAVLEVALDATHPLAFGIGKRNVGLLRRGRTALAVPADNPFTRVGAYSEAPLLNGYLPDGYAAEIAGEPAIVAVPRGEGVVVAFADDPAFRAIWWVGQRLVSNAVAFGSVIRAPEGVYGVPPASSSSSRATLRGEPVRRASSR